MNCSMCSEVNSYQILILSLFSTCTGCCLKKLVLHNDTVRVSSTTKGTTVPYTLLGYTTRKAKFIPVGHCCVCC